MYNAIQGLVTVYLGAKGNINVSQQYYEKVGFQCTPESESTLNVYGKEREFQLPDGKKAIFEMHVKIGQKTRIHFLVEDGIVYIGHCGKHLSV